VSVVLKPFAAYAPPPIRPLMAQETPPIERARMIGDWIDRSLNAGEFERLTSSQRCHLRALVFACDLLAHDLRDAEAARAPMRRVRWWRRVFG
jgi:hypothetical protein